MVVMLLYIISVDETEYLNNTIIERPPLTRVERGFIPHG